MAAGLNGTFQELRAGRSPSFGGVSFTSIPGTNLTAGGAIRRLRNLNDGVEVAQSPDRTLEAGGGISSDEGGGLSGGEDPLSEDINDGVLRGAGGALRRFPEATKGSNLRAFCQ